MPTQEATNIFETIKNIFANFITNENYINLISIVVVAFTTYRVTKYTTLKPNRLAIKQSQLDNVYMPLFRLLNEMPKSVSKHAAIIYNKKISNILDRHYTLAFPQLHRLNHTLREDIAHNLNFDKTLRIIKHQVDIDYEFLKKDLGYPSENFGDIFKRMTLKQKLTCIFPWFDALWLFIPGIISYFLSGILGKYVIIVLLALILLGVFIVYKLNVFINSMKD